MGPDLREAVDRVLRNRRLDGATVVLFGHSPLTTSIHGLLVERGVAVRAYLDNNPRKQGSVFDGASIVAPEHVTTLDGPRTVVLLASSHADTMRDQLRSLGFEGEVLNVITPPAPGDGTALVADLRDRFPEHYLVVCPYDGLGDVYWMLAYLPAFCAANAIENVAAVVVGRGCEQVAGAFDVDVAAVLDRPRMEDLLGALASSDDENHTVGFTPDRSGSPRLLEPEPLTLLDYYRCIVYGLDEDAVPVAPARLEPFDNTVGMTPGTSVIIAPYAKSVIAAPLSFWEAVVTEQIAAGQTVYTNVAGAEQALPRTQPLRLPLCQMVAALEHAGTFIGLRSGLCDLVHPALARKIAVYPDAYYSTTPHKLADFFALPGWAEVVVPIG